MLCDTVLRSWNQLGTIAAGGEYWRLDFLFRIALRTADPYGLDPSLIDCAVDGASFRMSPFELDDAPSSSGFSGTTDSSSCGPCDGAERAFREWWNGRVAADRSVG